MKNAKVVIDAGHGGTDSGAVGNGIVEKEYTLKISNYIHNRLDELGIPNKMVRTTDETVSPSERTKRVLNAYGPGRDVLVVSNHINAGGGDGAEVIYALRNNDTFARTITEELAAEGQNIRKYFQQRLPGNPSKDYFFMLRDTPNTEAVIVEYGFLDSTKDDVEQLKNNWQNYAEAVVRAIVKYLGGNYIPTPGSNYYSVQKGDSLWSIAKKLGVSVDELKKYNNLTSNMLTVGQTLRIPEKETTTPGTTEGVVYTVKSGDSLWKIANQYGVSVNDIKNENNLTSNNLSIGQTLVIPVPNEFSPSGGTVYTVQSGDTVFMGNNE